MRIKKAEIAGFGKWRQQSFSFEAENQLVYGLNEAGKSTLYQFIQAILFGFPPKRKKSPNYAPTDGSAYGGKLFLHVPLHGMITVERFKNKNNGKATILLEEGRYGDESLLEELLYPLTQELFQQVFTFQQEQLQQLDNIQEENLHEALISLGVSGSQQLFEKKQQLQKKSGQIYLPKGRKQPLNHAIQDYEELRQKIKEKEVKEAAFQVLVQQADAYKAQVSQQETLLQENQKQRFVLEQQQLNWEYHEELERLRAADLTSVGTEQQYQQVGDFYQEYQQLGKERARLRQSLRSNGERDLGTARYYFYLEKEEELQRLLAQKADMLRMLEKKHEYQLAAGEGWLQTPQPFTSEREVHQLVAPVEAQEQQGNECAVRFQVIQGQRDQETAALDRYEQRHPELFSKRQRFPLFYLFPLPCVVSAFFVAAPIRYFLMIGAGVIGIFCFYNSRKKGSKDEWRSKLRQLDIYEEQLAQLAEEMTACKHRAQIQQQQVEKELSRRHLPVSTDIFELLQNNRAAQAYCACVALEKRLAQTAESFRFLQEWLPIQDKPLREKVRIVETFVKEMDQQRLAQVYQESTVIQQRMQENHEQQRRMLVENQELLGQLGVKEPSEIPEFLRQQREIKQKIMRMEELSRRLSPLFSKPISQEELNEQVQKVAQQRQEQQLVLRRLQEQEQRLRLQIEQQKTDGTLDSLYQQESQQRARIESLLQAYVLTKLEGQLLQDIATELSEKQLPELLQQGTRYLRILTNKSTCQLNFSEGVLTVDQQSVYDLSTGTRDQVVMAIRFAYLALQKNQPLAPIVIDDGWLHYDHQRKYQLAKLLAEFSQNYQIICLSSDKEMLSYYQELDQPIWELKGANQ